MHKCSQSCLIRLFSDSWKALRWDFNRGNLSTVKMVSSGWQWQSKPVATCAFGVFACHVNFRFWSYYVNSHWLGRRWYRARVRTKQGRIVACGTSWNSRLCSHQFGREQINNDCKSSGDPVYFYWNNSYGECHSRASARWMWVLPPYMWYSAVVRLPLLFTRLYILTR